MITLPGAHRNASAATASISPAALQVLQAVQKGGVEPAPACLGNTVPFENCIFKKCSTTMGGKSLRYHPSLNKRRVQRSLYTSFRRNTADV